MSVIEKTIEKLKDQFKESILDVTEFRGETTVKAKKQDIVKISRLLHDDPELSYDYLSDVVGVDYLGNKPRFEVVYHLYSITNNTRLRVKVDVDEKDPKVDTVTTIWRSADWPERECYDLFGIKFNHHPDLRRILLPDEWNGHPLRKDYPLKGEDQC
ncbi:MAG: NADH-quinone oxidoreductase subunit C [Thermodesulfobacteriota bacterium]|nr:NADH-quinone oxidoreductase subunit C [Thermodesulfobacteriota bacterium]